MPVTEVALLHLSQGVTIEDANLRSKLAHAKTVMQNYTGRIFYYLQQVEDPTYIYIIGEWDSLDHHIIDFIPSADNQAVLESLKGLLSVRWLQHIDAPHADLPLPGPGTGNTKGLVYSFVRYFVKDGQRDQFRQTYEDEQDHLQSFVTEGRIGGGWRIDNEGGKEEWVRLISWTNVEQHRAFAETDGFAENSKIREHIDGVEIKGAYILEI
jgi:heme-degrading monooxygenase HmoA